MRSLPTRRPGSNRTRNSIFYSQREQANFITDEKLRQWMDAAKEEWLKSQVISELEFQRRTIIKRLERALGEDASARVEKLDKLKESDLYEPARDWCRAQGLTVYIEQFWADIIGYNECAADPKIVVVELKLFDWQKLFDQCCERAKWADEVWGVLVADPAKVRKDQFERHGFGLMCLWRGVLHQVLDARQLSPQNEHERAGFLKRLEYLSPALDHEIAGLPSCTASQRQRLAILERSLANLDGQSR